MVKYKTSNAEADANLLMVSLIVYISIYSVLHNVFLLLKYNAGVKSLLTFLHTFREITNIMIVIVVN